MYNDDVDVNGGGIRFYLLIRSLPHNEADIQRGETGPQLDSDSEWSGAGQS